MAMLAHRRLAHRVSSHLTFAWPISLSCSLSLVLAPKPNGPAFHIVWSTPAYLFRPLTSRIPAAEPGPVLFLATFPLAEHSLVSALEYRGYAAAAAAATTTTTTTTTTNTYHVLHRMYVIRMYVCT
ncbi:hypothetical protein LY76DRAFT_595222 [Colletotrichum caudatum]|nr:hypothetical protein LY76DRAFT_595222 [Colletotrichum caudatum]